MSEQQKSVVLKSKQMPETFLGGVEAPPPPPPPAPVDPAVAKKLEKASSAINSALRHIREVQAFGSKKDQQRIEENRAKLRARLVPAIEIAEAALAELIPLRSVHQTQIKQLVATRGTHDALTGDDWQMVIDGESDDGPQLSPGDGIARRACPRCRR